MTPGNETGGLDAPTAAVFGPVGSLYVASFSRDEVLRYDIKTGAALGTLVPRNGGGLRGGTYIELLRPSFSKALGTTSGPKQQQR